MNNIETPNISTEIAEALLSINAVKLSPKSPFTWASGLKSPIYCDNRITLSHPKVRSLIMNGFASRCLKTPNFDLIAGVATGGIAHGALVAHKLEKPFIYVRSSKKKHGTGKQVEGAFSSGQKCIVIEDLISTGKSSLEAVSAMREEKLEIMKVISIFTYDMNEAKNRFESDHCEYESLISYSELIQVAKKKEYISADDLDTLNAWNKDPLNWISK